MFLEQQVPCLRNEYVCNWQTPNVFPEQVGEVRLTEELNFEKVMERAVVQYLVQEGVSEA